MSLTSGKPSSRKPGRHTPSRSLGRRRTRVSRRKLQAVRIPEVCKSRYGHIRRMLAPEPRTTKAPPSRGLQVPPHHTCQMRETNESDALPYQVRDRPVSAP
jgi:hypothetical protein